jgi:hypothetical protein
MRWIQSFLIMGVLVGAAGAVRGQSLAHSKWKTYYLPIGDSMEVSFGADSMMVTTGKGSVLLLSTFKVDSGIVVLHDYGGEKGCALPGRYLIRIVADTMILVVDADRCEGRSSTLMAKRWVREAMPPQAAVKPGSKGRKKG